MGPRLVTPVRSAPSGSVTINSRLNPNCLELRAPSLAYSGSALAPYLGSALASFRAAGSVSVRPRIRKCPGNRFPRFRTPLVYARPFGPVETGR
jgi:hypothetical protein